MVTSLMPVFWLFDKRIAYTCHSGLTSSTYGGVS